MTAIARRIIVSYSREGWLQRHAQRGSASAEAELHDVLARLHRARRQLPGIARALVQARVDGTSRSGAAPPRIADVRSRDPARAHRHDHRDVAAQRGIRLLPELRVAEAR